MDSDRGGKRRGGVSSPGLGAGISLFDLVWSEQKQGRAEKATRSAGRLSGHVAGEGSGIKDRGGAARRRGSKRLEWIPTG